MKSLQRIFKNTVALSLTSFLRLGVGLVLTVYIARSLGPEVLGKYALLIAYVNIFQILSEAGIPRLVTREVARAPGQSGRYFWNALAVQVGCSLLAVLLMIAAVEVLDYPADTRAMLYWATGCLTAYSVSAAAAAVLQAHERMEFSTLAEAISSVGQLVATIVVLRAGYGVVGIALVKVLGFALVALVNVVAAWRLRFVGRPRFAWRFGLGMLREARSILLMAIFGAVLLRLDVLIITQMRGEAVTGTYNAAYQLVKAFVLLVWAYSDAIYPVLSRSFREGKPQLPAAITASLQYGALLILPLAVGGTMLAAQVIDLIYDRASYAQAAWALRILIWHLLPFFAHTLLVRALIAADRQDLAGRIEGMVLVIAILYQSVLIYFFGMIGASVAACLTFATAVLLSGRALTRVVGRLEVPWLRIGRAAVAALGLAGILWLTRSASLWVQVPVGAIAYVALVLLLGAVSAADRRMLAELWQRAQPQPPH